MRRFIILSVLGVGLCFGGTTMAQAAVVKRVETKVTVQKEIVTEHVGGARYVHFSTRHWSRGFRVHR